MSHLLCLFSNFQPMTDEHLIDIVDNDWRNDKLPNEDIQLPMNKLPDPEENENQSSLKDQVGKHFKISYRKKYKFSSKLLNLISNRLQEDKWLDIAIMSRYTEEQLNNSVV